MTTPAGSTDVSGVVTRYFAIVADLQTSPDALGSVLHPDFRFTEHPNAMNPAGTVRDREQALAAYAAGKRMLATQELELHEVLVSGPRAATRSTWRGRLSVDVGRLPPGTVLVARAAGFLTVQDGLVRSHETFDCYDPPDLG